MIKVSKLPGVIMEKQERQRQESINKVLRAIHELSNEGVNIRIKDLIERTGLARSTFAKKHIRDVLVEKGIVESRKENTKIKNIIVITFLSNTLVVKSSEELQHN